jgi:hypothetical protein
MGSRGELLAGLRTRQASDMTDCDVNKQAAVIRCSSAVKWSNYGVKLSYRTYSSVPHATVFIVWLGQVVKCSWVKCEV